MGPSVPLLVYSSSSQLLSRSPPHHVFASHRSMGDAAAPASSVHLAEEGEILTMCFLHPVIVFLLNNDV